MAREDRLASTVTSVHPVQRLGVVDTARVLCTVIAPTLAAGVIKRRPWLMRLTERLGLDRRAITTMRRLRARHGPAPVAVRVPGRTFVFPLSEVDAGRILAATPDPFTPATTENRAALRHFQPHAVLISTGAERQDRRAFNETVLQPARELHSLAPHIIDVVHAEIAALRTDGELTWDEFNRQWWRIVRRITLGRDDEGLTELLGTLRAAGNWAYLLPRRRGDRARFLARVAEHVRRAEPGSLAAHVAATPAPGNVDPAGQLPHWLFAFDAAGMAAFRALALLARHPDQLRAAHADVDTADLNHPYLRACVLDTVRLWPTTPALLRQSIRDTDWGPAGTTTFLYTPYFHRDPDTLPAADRFAPDAWLDGIAAAHPALTPFSAGPGECPGRNLVLHATSTTLAAILTDHHVRLHSKHAINPPDPLPATLDNFSVRRRLTPR